jgi:predicted RNase H-like nuclease (RuvC/YqgF family)
MVEIIKTNEETKNNQQNTAKTRKILEETPKEKNTSEKPNTLVIFESTEENILSMLEALGGEEKQLLAEKTQLLNMEETLRQKIQDEIEIKRNRIENLKYEIPELRQRCETLAKVLNIPVQK